MAAGPSRRRQPLMYYAPLTTGSGSAAPSAVGTYTAVANFAGSTDYAAAGGARAVFTITPATATVTVTSGNATYTGTAYVPATTVTGIQGADSNPTVTYSYYVGTEHERHQPRLGAEQRRHLHRGRQLRRRRVLQRRQQQPDDLRHHPDQHQRRRQPMPAASTPARPTRPRHRPTIPPASKASPQPSRTTAATSATRW